MKHVESARDRPEVAEKFDDQDWEKVDVGADSGPLASGESAVFRTHFAATSEELAAPEVRLNFGMIDDDGWIYINGQLAGESHDWQSSPTFEVHKLLHPGENSLAVAIKNNEGSGGLNKGAQLEFRPRLIPADWKRSVFNGLAQILVQSTKEPGEIKLTARADSLEPATLTIETRPCSARPAVP